MGRARAGDPARPVLRDAFCPCHHSTGGGGPMQTASGVAPIVSGATLNVLQRHGSTGTIHDVSGQRHRQQTVVSGGSCGRSAASENVLPPSRAVAYNHILRPLLPPSPSRSNAVTPGSFAPQEPP